MSFTHAKPGPPFDFLGTITESQKEALEAWVGVHKQDFTAISQFHQIRAHQLRKTAGALETFYAERDPQKRKLAPTFRKDPWQPAEGGHFFPTRRDDQGPSNAMFDLKDRFQYPMAADDEAVFRMNFVRTRLEFQEDLAQEASEGSDFVTQKLQDLTRYFADPHYRMTCVRDKTDLYKGQPRVRVHPLDPPTPYEVETRY